MFVHAASYLLKLFWTAAILVPWMGNMALAQGVIPSDGRIAQAESHRPPFDERSKRPTRRAANFTLPAEVATLERLSVILGRPTDRSVTINVLSRDEREIYVEFGGASGKLLQRTEIVRVFADQPSEIILTDLARDSRHFYRLRHRSPGEREFQAGIERAFHSQRAPGSEFVFEVQGDSHPERAHQFDPALYVRTLSAAAEDRPDFYVLMGDDFSVDTLPAIDAKSVNGRYVLQRPFLSIVGGNSPLFLVNGNHEQASAANLDGSPDNVAVWAQTARNKFYPQPAPDGFYTGDNTPVPHIGELRDYFAWHWGDALFVVIDPYWHSTEAVDNEPGGREKKLRDRWAITLGDAQYGWLKRTLESSKARFKFVFCHHVLGSGRGGIEQAQFFEWGGNNRRGINEFAARRPGWELPIHRLMAKTGVTIFFQGHDHVFARQELDGVIYQTLPQPADPNYALYYREAYRSGDILPNSGRVRVRVSADKIRVEYVRSYRPEDETAAHPNGEIAFSYEVAVFKPAVAR